MDASSGFVIGVDTDDIDVSFAVEHDGIRKDLDTVVGCSGMEFAGVSAGRVEHLDAPIMKVGNVHIPRLVDCHVDWIVEFARRRSWTVP